MKKKLMAMLLSMALLGSLAGCGVSTTAPSGADDKSSSASASKDTKADGKTIGILMPTKSSERWIKDGDDMVKGLKELGLTKLTLSLESSICRGCCRNSSSTS